MSNVIDGILMAHLPAIARVDARPQRMIQQWLGGGTFTPRLIEPKKIILERVDWEGLTEAIASDVDRLAKAGRETLQVTSCVEGMPKASAWILIQAYYASFYYAQSILRVCGIIPSYYSPGELSNLSKIMDAYSVALPFTLKGQLLLSIDGEAKTVTIERGDGGASHEATWHEFNLLLSKLDELVKSSPLEAENQFQVLSDINRLKTAVSGPSHAQSRLSSIRNSVQYRQELGGWYPYAQPTKADDLKRRINTSLSTRIDLSSFDLSHHSSSIRFLESCLCVCAAGRSLLIRLESLYGSGFLKNGYCKLENQYGRLTAIV